MTAKVFKGSFWVLAGQVLPLLATFISTPFVIRILGTESYGVLILLGLISMYLSFADFGMGLTSTKFGSEAYAEHNTEKEGKIIRTAATIASGTSLLFIIPMIIVPGWIVGDLLTVPEHLRSTASLGLRLTAIAFFVNILSSVFNTPQISRLRMDLNVLINAGGKVIMILATPLVLYFGGGIVEAVFVALVTAIGVFAVNLYMSSRLLPGLLRFSTGREYWKPLLRFGGSIVLYGIGLTLINHLEKFFVTRYSSVTSLAYYSVASTFALMTTMFSTAMVQSLLPAFSQLMKPDKQTELLALFQRTVRFSFIVLIPAILFLLIIARPFFTIWAGPDFGRESIQPYYILLIGIFFGISAYIPNCVLMASGRPNLFAKFYLFEVIPYALIAFFLVRQWGIIGGAIAFSLRETVNSLVFIYFVKKHMGERFSVWDGVAKYLFGGLILLPVTVFALLVDNFSPWLILLVPLNLLCYGYLAWNSFLTPNERDWAAQQLALIKKRLPWL